MRRNIVTYLIPVVAILLVAMSACTKHEQSPIARDFYALLDSAAKCRTLGLYDSALVFVEMASNKAASPFHGACVKERRAHILYRQGDKERARQLLHEVLDFVDRLQSPGVRENYLKLHALGVLASIEGDDARVKDALRLHMRSAKLAMELHEVQQYITSQMYIFEYEYRKGSYASAIEGLRELLAFCDREGTMGLDRLKILNGLFKAYFALGDIEEAKLYTKRMEELLPENDYTANAMYNVSLYYLSDSIRNASVQRKCIDELQRAISSSRLSFKDNVEALQVLSLHSIKQNELEDASKYLKMLYDLESQEPKERRSLKSEMLLLRYLLATQQVDSATRVLEGVDVQRYRDTDLIQYTIYLAYKSWFAYVVKDYKSSYSLLKQRTMIMDSLRQESISHNLAYKDLQHRRDATILSQQLRIKHQQNELDGMEVQRQIWIVLGIISSLVALLIVIVYRNIRIKRRNAQVKQHNQRLKAEVEHQLDMLEKREVELRRKNYQLQEQIKYASNIQSNMLPDSDSLRSGSFSEMFVIYRPCAMISGDFYWTTQSGSKKYICVGDATGHGIPGAFIAMVSSTILNDIAHSMPDPTPLSLLVELDKNIRSILMTNDNTHANDSVDASMLCIDEKTRKVTLALSRHNAYMVRHTGEVVRLSGVKRSIGDVDPEFMKRPFEEIELDVMQDDCLYLTTDGYESQLGGPQNKKFKRTRMVEMLSKYRFYSMSEQRHYLLSNLEEWMDENEQTDDILMIGVRF
ncbi:MAG: SpoIIE family protein phosphatase [Bacteroidales bacterium]|nr:SpoIIE family protein phosphatase [Bacteroidales bacterium]